MLERDAPEQRADAAWVRNDVRSSLAGGEARDDDYVLAQMRAFRELRSCGWDPSGRRG